MSVQIGGIPPISEIKNIVHKIDEKNILTTSEIYEYVDALVSKDFGTSSTAFSDEWNVTSGENKRTEEPSFVLNDNDISSSKNDTQCVTICPNSGIYNWSCINADLSFATRKVSCTLVDQNDCVLPCCLYNVGNRLNSAADIPVLDEISSWPLEEGQGNDLKHCCVKLNRLNLTRIYVSGNPFKLICFHCKTSFLTIELLLAHKILHRSCAPDLNPFKSSKVVTPRNNNAEAYICNVCKKICSTKAQCAVHVRRHAFPDDSSCWICKKNFKTFGNLSRHMLTHTNERLFQCGKCCKRFSCDSLLRKHFLMHLNLDSYMCPICRQTYRDLTYFRVHLSSHACHKEINCDFCQKSFSDMSYYRKHLIFHTTHKRYMCPKCGERFYRSDYLKSHLRKHNTSDTLLLCTSKNIHPLEDTRKCFNSVFSC